MYSTTRALPLLALLAIIAGRSNGSLELKPDMAEVVRYVNETFMVSCEGPGATGINWQSPSGQTIQKEGRVHVETRSDEVVALVFESIARSDRGNYSCSATMDNKIVKKTFTLTVVTDISFQGCSLEQNATEGQDYVLRCEVRGDPPPTVTWHFQGRSLNDNRYMTMSAGLRISNVTYKDAGEYQCRGFQISSLTSDIKQKTISLNVLHKPYWLEKSEANEVGYGFVGGSANLSCMASANPEPEYVWTRNNETLEHEVNSTYTIVQDDQGSSLLFTIEHNGYFGEYECSARNPLGEIRNTIELRRGLKPARPSSVSVLRTGRSTAKLNITVGQTPSQSSEEDEEDERLPVTGFRIEFQPANSDQAFTWDDSPYEEVTVDPNNGSTYTLIGLSEDTEYLVRVAAINPAGLGHYSEEFRLRTRGSSASSAKTVHRHSLLVLLVPSLISCFVFPLLRL